MPTRDERRAEASKHLALMKGAFAKETQATIDAAVVYEDGDALALELPEPTAEATETQVTSDFTTTALRRAQGKTAIVDPVSYTRPGGAYEDGSFGVNQTITRQEMAAILYRYAQYKKLDTSVGENTNILGFEDASQLSEYAIPAMQWAVGAGVINGTTASTLSPSGDASRAQAANILYRFLSTCQK